MIVEGINVVKELLNSSVGIDRIILENSKNKDILNILDIANTKGVKVQVVDKKDLERIAKGKTQGVIAYVQNFKYVDVKDIMLEAERKGEKPFIVILDGIEDPHNLGAIIRTCECAGVHGIIIPKRRSASLNATVAKAACGALEYMKVARVTNIPNTIDELKEKGVWVFGADMDGNDFERTDLDIPCALVIGNEGKGIGTLVAKKCDEIISLPMMGKINSLNASVAAGVLMYEVVRKRRK